MTLRFLDLTLPTIEENLALDDALLSEVEEGREPPLLRLWELGRPAVVLGASGRMNQDVVVASCESDGIPIARRSSGGGTVVIGPGALNFAVVLPRDFAPGLDAVDFAQNYVLERVAEQFRRFVPAVEVLGSGDLTVHRRKVSGSAQRRLKRHFLVHATVLYDFPLDLIDRYTRTPERQPSYREQRSHGDFVANLEISRPQLIEAVRHAWKVDDSTHVEVPYEAIRALVSEKFADPSWVKRL